MAVSQPQDIARRFVTRLKAAQLLVALRPGVEEDRVEASRRLGRGASRHLQAAGTTLGNSEGGTSATFPSSRGGAQQAQEPVTQDQPTFGGAQKRNMPTWR